MAAGLIISLETLRNTHPAEYMQRSPDRHKETTGTAPRQYFLDRHEESDMTLLLSDSKLLYNANKDDSPIFKCIQPGSPGRKRLCYESWKLEMTKRRWTLSSFAGLISAKTGAKRWNCQYKSRWPSLLPTNSLFSRESCLFPLGFSPSPAPYLLPRSLCSPDWDDVIVTEESEISKHPKVQIILRFYLKKGNFGRAELWS